MLNVCHWHSAPSVLPADKTKLLPLSLRHVFRSACFSKILRIGFCENKKADAISSFTKIQNTSAQSFDLIGHYSFLLTDSYRPFLIMSKTKGTNFFTVNALWVNHYFILQFSSRPSKFSSGRSILFTASFMS